MKSTIRIAGAQIPVGSDIEVNKKEILKALDWAKENKVDHLLTPEAALSGYTPYWKDNLTQLYDALSEICEFQKNSGVCLHLGTYFQENEIGGNIFRNQIRHYHTSGASLSTNKTYVVKPDEGVIGRDEDENLRGIPLSDDSQYFAVGMICNDMYQKSITDTSSIMHELRGRDLDGLRLIMHATNGRKFADNDFRCESYFNFHNSLLRMSSIYSKIPILTVDSCAAWDWDGNEDTIDTYQTSSRSGVLDFTGWLTDVPERGRQYFYHDLDISEMPDHKMLKYIEDNNLPYWEY
tara:strand:+ start:1758 stop:2636 length:879 start_codon:yes stop_codon:yes gene_type:complete